MSGENKEFLKMLGKPYGKRSFLSFIEPNVNFVKWNAYIETMNSDAYKEAFEKIFSEFNKSSCCINKSRHFMLAAYYALCKHDPHKVDHFALTVFILMLNSKLYCSCEFDLICDLLDNKEDLVESRLNSYKQHYGKNRVEITEQNVLKKVIASFTYKEYKLLNSCKIDLPQIFKLLSLDYKEILRSKEYLKSLYISINFPLDSAAKYANFKWIFYDFLYPQMEIRFKEEKSYEPLEKYIKLFDGEGDSSPIIKNLLTKSVTRPLNPTETKDLITVVQDEPDIYYNMDISTKQIKTLSMLNPEICVCMIQKCSKFGLTLSMLPYYKHLHFSRKICRALNYVFESECCIVIKDFGEILSNMIEQGKPMDVADIKSIFTGYFRVININVGVKKQIKSILSPLLYQLYIDPDSAMLLNEFFFNNRFHWD